MGGQKKYLGGGGGGGSQSYVYPRVELSSPLFLHHIERLLIDLMTNFNM